MSQFRPKLNHRWPRRMPLSATPKDHDRPRTRREKRIAKAQSRAERGIRS